MSDPLRPHRLQHAGVPCLSPTPRVYSNSFPLSWWCHPTISSSVIPIFSCLQSFPASGSFQMSQFFTSGGQSIGVSASAPVLPMNIQDWSPLGWTGWISLQSKGLTRVFSNTTVHGSAGKESTCNAGDLGSIPGLGRSPGGGKGYPLQYSGLENSMDCIDHGVTKSQTQLSNFHFPSTHPPTNPFI